MSELGFFFDTEGDENLLDQEQLVDEVEESPISKVENEPLEEFLKIIKIAAVKLQDDSKRKNSEGSHGRNVKTDEAIDRFYVEMGWGPKIGEQTVKSKLKRRRNNFKFDNVDLETGKLVSDSIEENVKKHLKKAVVGPEIEKQISLPEYNVSERRLKAIRKKEREKTKGPSWFNMPAPEITETVKNDLEILKMRSALDPKRFYKKNDMETLPKYFQTGTVVDSALDHTNVRLTKKERKRTLVDELLADAEFNRYNKRKYKEITEEKRKATYKTYIKDKRKKNKEAFKQKKKEKTLRNENMRKKRKVQD